MKKREVIIGSRDSKLAIAQTMLVINQLTDYNPDISFRLISMKTSGDLILDKNIDEIGGKGLFVKELDRALRDGTIDLAIHSLKDLPMNVPEDLPILAFSKRERPEDVLVLPKDVEKMDRALPIGTSSARRTLQSMDLFPDMQTASIRGNIQTRLNKLDSGQYSALILAYAGLKRLNLENRITRIFTIDEMLPSAGQGTLVIQGRKNENYDYLNCIEDENARLEATAERSFVTYLDGGCTEPIAAFAEVNDDKISIHGFYHNPETGVVYKGVTRGAKEEGDVLAVSLAKELKAGKNEYTK